MLHALDFKAGGLERRRERCGGEVRAMLVKKIPHHQIGKYPFNTRRLKKDTRLWGARQSLLNVLEHLEWARNVLDDVAADDHVGWDVSAFRIIIARGKL